MAEFTADGGFDRFDRNSQSLERMAPVAIPARVQNPLSCGLRRLAAIGVRGPAAGETVRHLESGDCSLHEWKVYNRYR